MANRPLIAGFDAGQTHTRCRLARLDETGRWQTIAAGDGPGVSHLAADGGEVRFRTALRDSLQAAWAALPAGAPQLAAAAIGASGIESGSAVQQLGETLAAATLELPQQQVVVCGDERTALEGARGKASAGILLISGTGCIGLGRNALGQLHRCGGWGWLLDGAGSATDIGRDGLALSLQMADSRQGETPLRAAVWAALGLAADDPAAAQAIKARVVQADFGAAGFARLAPVVHAQASAGDAGAAAIVARSGVALAEMAIAIARQLALEAPPVWPSGGALAHLPLLRQALQQTLAQRCPGTQLAHAAGDACEGALGLAAERALRRR